jgi:hypothetical protein
MAPTALPRRQTGSRGVYATQWTGGYPPELWYRYMTESDNYHDGTFTRWICSLVGRSLQHSGQFFVFLYIAEKIS